MKEGEDAETICMAKSVELVKSKRCFSLENAEECSVSFKIVVRIQTEVSTEMLSLHVPSTSLLASNSSGAVGHPHEWFQLKWAANMSTMLLTLKELLPGISNNEEPLEG